jgi:hypothetical protein
MSLVNDTTESPCQVEIQPNGYSVWVYDRGADDEPILFVAYEWEEAGLRAVRVDCVWLHEDETGRVAWEDHPEFNNISGGVEAAVFARMITSKKVRRIGPMPPIGRYAQPPTWLSVST